MIEQRRDPRAFVRFKIDQLVVTQSPYSSMNDEEVYMSAEATNISVGGIGCSSSSAVEPLSQVFIMFSIPASGGARRNISCEGFVAHSHGGSGSCAFGIKFLNLAPNDRAAIDAYVSSVLAQ
jgi:c-di-GMP-binding flagellar brake protein YcgR